MIPSFYPEAQAEEACKSVVYQAGLVAVHYATLSTQEGEPTQEQYLDLTSYLESVIEDAKIALALLRA